MKVWYILRSIAAAKRGSVPFLFPKSLLFPFASLLFLYYFSIMTVSFQTVLTNLNPTLLANKRSYCFCFYFKTCSFESGRVEESFKVEKKRKQQVACSPEATNKPYSDKSLKVQESRSHSISHHATTTGTIANR